MNNKGVDAIDEVRKGIEELYKFEEEEREKRYKEVKIPLTFVNKSNNMDPKHETEGSSGFDIRAFLDKPITIKPGKRAIIPTGLYFDIPLGFEIQVRPRSGLAAKFGVTVLNTPGTIDSDYTGEVKIILVNFSDIDFIVTNGDRVAQGVFAGVINSTIISLQKVDTINKNTERGSGGFGSTGIN